MPTPTLRDVHPADRPLSNISIAYMNAEYIGEMVFPHVPVMKKSDLFFNFDAQSWQRSEIAPRAPGTRAQRGGYTLSTASYACINYAIGTPIPDEIRENSDQPLKIAA